MPWRIKSHRPASLISGVGKTAQREPGEVDNEISFYFRGLFRDRKGEGTGKALFHGVFDLPEKGAQKSVGDGPSAYAQGAEQGDQIALVGGDFLENVFVGFAAGRSAEHQDVGISGRLPKGLQADQMGRPADEGLFEVTQGEGCAVPGRDAEVVAFFGQDHHGKREDVVRRSGAAGKPGRRLRRASSPRHGSGQSV